MVETFYSYPGAPYLALLGDFHNGDMEPVICSLRKHLPSLICIAGDVVYRRVPKNGLLVDVQKNVLPLLQDCASLAPTFLALGNHEAILTTADVKKIRTTGVTILDNEWKTVTIADKEYHLGGLTSHAVLERRATIPMNRYNRVWGELHTRLPGSGQLASARCLHFRARCARSNCGRGARATLHFRARRISCASNARVPWLDCGRGACATPSGCRMSAHASMAAARHPTLTKKRLKQRKNQIKEPKTDWITPVPEGYTILLSHHPEYLPLLPKSIDLVLSAHAHGGQWRIFNHGVYAPNQGWWPKWTRGIYGNMIVSAGLTNTANVPRIFNPPEIVYINRPAPTA